MAALSLDRLLVWSICRKRVDFSCKISLDTRLHALILPTMVLNQCIDVGPGRLELSKVHIPVTRNIQVIRVVIELKSEIGILTELRITRLP